MLIEKQKENQESGCVSFYSGRYIYTYDQTIDIEYTGKDPNKQLFGYFECDDCGAWWESAYSWVDYGQQCKNCFKMIFPYRLTEKKIIYLAYFYCNTCGVDWKQYIYVIGTNNENVDDRYNEPQYQEDYNYRENYDYENYEEGIYNDYYENEKYYNYEQNRITDWYQEDPVRYDLEPQMCSCGEFVYPIISNHYRVIGHQKKLCGKCQSIGNCTRY